MGCFEAFVQAWRKAVVFQGRARRKEYWCFKLFGIIVFIALIFVDVSMGTFDETSQEVVVLLSGLYALAAIVPATSLVIRRLHDINWSGLWYLAFFVPVLNLFPMFGVMFADGSPGPNRFGPDPKGRQAPQDAG